jgi:hypothetical protein
MKKMFVFLFVFSYLYLWLLYVILLKKFLVTSKGKMPFRIIPEM